MARGKDAYTILLESSPIGKYEEGPKERTTWRRPARIDRLHQWHFHLSSLVQEDLTPGKGQLLLCSVGALSWYLSQCQMVANNLAALTCFSFLFLGGAAITFVQTWRDKSTTRTTTNCTFRGLPRVTIYVLYKYKKSTLLTSSMVK